MLTVYTDTCVYRDLYEWRSGKKYIHQGEEAQRFFTRADDAGYRIVVSDHLDFQLHGFERYHTYKITLKKEGRLIEVKAKDNDRKMADLNAKKHPNTEFEDALHAELALKGGATVLVTWNVEHFAPYQDRLKIRMPQHVGLF